MMKLAERTGKAVDAAAGCEIDPKPRDNP